MFEYLFDFNTYFNSHKVKTIVECVNNSISFRCMCNKTCEKHLKQEKKISFIRPTLGKSDTKAKHIFKSNRTHLKGNQKHMCRCIIHMIYDHYKRTGCQMTHRIFHI